MVGRGSNSSVFTATQSGRKIGESLLVHAPSAACSAADSRHRQHNHPRGLYLPKDIHLWWTIVAEILMEARASDATLELYENKVRIVRKKGMSNLILHGAKGDKEILLKSISSIQFKKPSTWTGGYIQFAFMGGKEAMGGILEATSDENSIIFGPRELEDFERIKEAIEDRMATINKGDSPRHSDLDELEKLARLRDKGIITEEEFDAKKRHILKTWNK